MIFSKAPLFTLLAFAMLLSACGPAASSPGPSPTASESDPIQRLCLQGVQRALDLEIARYEGWLKNADKTQRAMYWRALDYLQRERKRYWGMPPNAFHLDEAWHYIPGVEIGIYGRAPLPPPKPLTLDDAWIRDPLPAMLYMPDQSRSGPFYLVVAVPEGMDLTPGTRYRLKIQPVMPRSYPFPSYYVCVLEAKAKPSPQSTP
ncbi:MAG TPA: hypothetical protein G4O04_03865 [Anaerolineae bacterium]|nr:hypothetical protein [Anaerolineae bacterium]HID83947.1 hypothetical protein [Anaerolineales bacterium]HIQ09233.1 hypothetical protein [Anaerolineaceae bacterium]